MRQPRSYISCNVCLQQVATQHFAAHPSICERHQFDGREGRLGSILLSGRRRLIAPKQYRLRSARPAAIKYLISAAERVFFSKMAQSQTAATRLLTFCLAAAAAAEFFNYYFVFKFIPCERRGLPGCRQRTGAICERAKG